jgi:hypothetical protein
LGERFGVFTLKGIVQFKSNKAQTVVGNLTAKEILAAFDENDYEIHAVQSNEHENNSTSADLTNSNEKTPKVDKRRYIVQEDTPNLVVHWKPLIRRKQTIVVDSSQTLKRLVGKEIFKIEKCSEKP